MDGPAGAITVSWMGWCQPCKPDTQQVKAFRGHDVGGQIFLQVAQSLRVSGRQVASQAGEFSCSSLVKDASAFMQSPCLIHSYWKLPLKPPCFGGRSQCMPLQPGWHV